MKYTICSALLLAVLLAVSFLSAQFVDDTVTETLSKLEAAEAAMEADDGRQCRRMLEQAENFWTDHEPWFGIVLRHDEVDQVLEQFAEVRSFADSQDDTEFFSKCAALMARLRHIREMEWPTFSNLL